MMMNYRDYIVRDSKVCGGQPVVKGTRVPIRTILASLAEGATIEEILRDFPTLTDDAVRAVIAFAAVSAEEDLPQDPRVRVAYYRTAGILPAIYAAAKIRGFFSLCRQDAGGTNQ